MAVAGILASLQITGKPIKDNVFVFQGAGEVSILFHIGPKMSLVFFYLQQSVSPFFFFAFDRKMFF